MPAKPELAYIAEYLTYPNEDLPSQLGCSVFWLACTTYSEIPFFQTPYEKHIREVEFARLCIILENNFPKEMQNMRRYEEWKMIIKNMCRDNRHEWWQVLSQSPPVYERLCELAVRVKAS